MPIDLRSKGGSGAYRPYKGYALEDVPAGSSGVLLNIQADDNKLVRLELLQESGTLGEEDVTLEIDGVEFITGRLDRSPLAGQNTFSVYQTGDTGSGGNAFSDIIGENIKLTKNAGTTTNTIQYSYSKGELK